MPPNMSNAHVVSTKQIGSYGVNSGTNMTLCPVVYTRIFGVFHLSLNILRSSSSKRDAITAVVLQLVRISEKSVVRKSVRYTYKSRCELARQVSTAWLIER